MGIDLENLVNKEVIAGIFNNVMIQISRKAKLLALEGKSYGHLEYSLSDIPKVLKGDMFSDIFISKLLNESDDNVVSFLLYVMDVYYNIDDNDDNVVKFLRDERFDKFRDEIFKW